MKSLLDTIQTEVKLTIKQLKEFEINKHNLDYCKNELEVLSDNILNTSKKIDCIIVMEKNIERWRKLNDNEYIDLKKPVSANRPRGFTKEQILHIRNSNASNRVLAVSFGVSPLSISNIRNFKTYKNI